MSSSVFQKPGADEINGHLDWLLTRIQIHPRERFRCEFDAKYPKATAKLDRDWQTLPRSDLWSEPHRGGGLR